ncbi:MAG: hypothetical protein RL154_933 [Pseudomonadota bacterium]|jgi:type IV secretory pathway TraG/TraD family ATPase VirD4
MVKWLGSKSEKALADEFVSGSKLITEKEMKAQTISQKAEFKIGSIHIPVKNEVTHFFIPGASGRGKTQALKPIIAKAKMRAGVKGIIHHIKGDWTSEFYLPAKGDLIFNPMDKRSLKWTIFNDIDDVIDIENFGKWAIPDLPNKDPFWQNSARLIFTACLKKCFFENKKTNADLKHLVSLNMENLALEFGSIDEQAAELASKRDSYLTFVTYVSWMVFLEDGDFSVRTWVQNENQSGFIFVANQPKFAEIFKPVLSLFVNVLGSAILSMPDNLNRRIFFFLDEFTSLSKLDEIVTLSNLGRSKGVSLWITLQNIEQMIELYGKRGKTLIENCSNSFCFGLNHPESADFMSSVFGKGVFIKKVKNIGMGVSDNKDGLNVSEQEKEEAVVKAGDLLNLVELQAYVKLNGVVGAALVKLNYKAYDNIAASFDQVEMTDLQNRMLAQAAFANKQKIEQKQAQALVAAKESENVESKSDDAEIEESY